MKAASKLLKEYAWGRAVTFTDAQAEVIDKAMKAYAEQAIDRVAEKAKENTATFSADRYTILSVKSELNEINFNQ